MASKLTLGIFLCVVAAAMAAPNKRMKPLKGWRSNKETSMELTKKCTGKVSGPTEDDVHVVVVIPIDGSHQQPKLGAAAPQWSSEEKHTKMVALRNAGIKGNQLGSSKVTSMGFSKEDLTNEVIGKENEERKVIYIIPIENKNKGQRPMPIVKNKGDKQSRPKFHY